MTTARPASSHPAGLRVLVADDEAPAREELAYLLGRDPRVVAVHTTSDGAETVKFLETADVDALFLDIRMPGLDGLDVARLLTRFRRAPCVVFVTAYDEHAVEAFDLHATDYLLKPVREERLTEAVRRVHDALGSGAGEMPAAKDETIAVELGGVTRFVAQSEVHYVEAQGDYVRLHTADGSHLVRVPLTTLEESWSAAGFLRIHRRHLVALHHIDEVRNESGHCVVRVGDDILPVSRRHTSELRDMLVRRARPGRGDT